MVVIVVVVYKACFSLLHESALSKRTQRNCIPKAAPADIMHSSILAIFQLTAMCPLPILNTISGCRETAPKHSTRARLLFIWSLFNIVFVVVVFFIVVIVYQTHFLKPKSSLSTFNDMANLSTRFLTHLVIIAESLWSRNEMFTFLYKLSQVNAELDKLYLDQKKRKFPLIEAYLMKCVIYWVLMWAIEVTIIIRVYGNREYSLYWCICIFSVVIGRLRHLQHALFVDVLTVRFTVVRKEMQRFVDFSKRNGKLVMDDLLIMAKIRMIKSVYSTLYEMNLHLNNSFGLSQLVNLMQNFIQLTSDLFWIYSEMYRNDFTNLIG